MSDHFDGRHFFNPNGAPAGKSLGKLLRWMATRTKARWPKWIDDPPAPPLPADPPEERAALTFVNHATFLLRLGGVHLVTDPIWSDRASPLSWAGPRRVRRPGLAFENQPPVHLVLVSHNHYDHLDVPTLRRLRDQFRPRFITGLGNRRYLEARGIEPVEELDWWQATHFQDLQITMTPAQHFSARSPFDRNRTLWGGFMIESGPLRVYFAADSGYCDHFKQIRERLGRPSVALLPFGAYEPRWFMRDSHVNPQEAVQAHRDLESPFSIGMHFGTFQLTDEAIDEPVKALQAGLAANGIDGREFIVPRFGETIEVVPHGRAAAGP